MITIKINSADVTSQIQAYTLNVTKRLTYKVDTANFNVLKAGSKTLTPAYDDDVEIYDGATKIFGGKILTVQTKPIGDGTGVYYAVSCADHTYELDKQLASKTYENQTIAQIIADLISSYTTGFTTTNVASTFNIEKIVFNQVPISTCIKRLADVLNYDWFVDKDKDVHFFAKHTTTAPYDLTDTNGNYIYKTLKRTRDGAEVANRIKVRGGEYNGATYTDRFTVNGDDTKSFKLPYKMANLTVTLDPDGAATAQTVGIDFIDDFTGNDVLHNFQEQTIRWENPLSDGDIVEFTGNPKIPVFAVAEDPVSIAAYGKIEKLVRKDYIESNTIARRLANAELYAYSEPIIDARFNTYTSGLEPGMLINLQSDKQSIDDDLIIKEITFTQRDTTSWEYRVGLISTKRYDFVTLLQKIIEPDPRPGDGQETSEEIFTDTQEITITEEYEVVAAFEDDQTITVTENYELDILGDDTNATYVLGPYTPTGQNDTKRPGRLDISLVAY